ncbi:MAG: hypothetical protein EA402_08745 [Planctomycetota bacterium]|nr:MAG: hypothetical protein EA402_08745 [Planctomycetota bacterium]
MAGERLCPICGKMMIEECRYGVTVDVCADHGIWLDNGELDKILRNRQGRMSATKRRQVRQARQEGRREGARFGWWSLLD